MTENNKLVGCNTSLAFDKSSKLVASIVSPTTVRLTIRKSRSTSAISALLQEAQQCSGATDKNARSLVIHRSHSLPSGLTSRRAPNAFNERTDKSEAGILSSKTARKFAAGEETTPVYSSNRMGQLEEEVKSSVVTVATLEKTISHMKAHIETLEGQLKDEAQNSGLLKEELEASRRLCCQLHLAGSRGDVARTGYQPLELEEDVPHHPAKTPAAVLTEHRFVQTLPSTETTSELAHQRYEWKRGTNVTDRFESMLQKEAETANEYYKDHITTLEDEILVLQQGCKEKDHQVRSITQQLSSYIHRSSKLEAEQVSLRECQQRTTNKLKSTEEQLLRSQKLLDKTIDEVTRLQEDKASLTQACAEWQEHAHKYEDEVTSLKEELGFNKQTCRSLNRKIQILNESLESTQGEVAQRETALETKNTILEAIKTIAYTSPSPRQSNHPNSRRSSVYSSPSNPMPVKHIRKVVEEEVASSPSDDPRHWLVASDVYESAPGKRDIECRRSRGETDLVAGVQDDSDEGSSSPTRHLSRDTKLSDWPSVSEELTGRFRTRASYGGEQQQQLKQQQVSKSNFSDEEEEEDQDSEEPCEADLSSTTDSESLSSEDEDVKYGVEAEGLVLRKQEQENYAMRSRDRSWHYVYIVQHGTLLWFYETREHKISGKTLQDEKPVDLRDAYVTVAMDYTRKKHVFRVQLATGQRYLFQARDDREMLYWVCCMDSAARCQTATTGGIPPSIGSVAAPKMGSPSKSDRIKRVIKGSISALTK